MIRTELDLTHLLPFDRGTAAKIATAASHFEARLTLERNDVVLNAKSMLGLLSQAHLLGGRYTLVADGADEQAATETLLALVKEE